MTLRSIPADRLPLRHIPVGQRTAPALLKFRAERKGEESLFSDLRSRYTGSQTLRDASTRADVPAAAGVKKGDRVALLCTNHVEFLYILLGCGWLGAVVVRINTASCGARLLVVENRLIGLLTDVDLRATTLESAWVIRGDGAAGPLALDTQPLPPLGDPCEATDIGPGDTLAILYTSGTSGPSKGVICACPRNITARSSSVAASACSKASLNRDQLRAGPRHRGSIRRLHGPPGRRLPGTRR